MLPRLSGNVSAAIRSEQESQLTSHVQGQDDTRPDIVAADGHRDRPTAIGFAIDVLAFVVLNQELAALDSSFENGHDMGAG